MAQSVIAELVVSHPDLPLAPTLDEITDISIAVEAQPLTPLTAAGGPAIFFSVRDSGFQKFESALDTDFTVDQWQISMSVANCRLYQITLSPHSKLITPEITALGIRILSIQSTEEGWLFKLQAPDKESLGAYWQHCRDEDVRFDLQRLYSTGPRAQFVDSHGLEANLTDRQREVAYTVTRMGYYESDGADADSVAAELGISPSTLSTHLRRIIAKIFDQVFGRNS